MRLTTRTNLAARVLMYCAVNNGHLVRSSQIAAGCNAAPNHVARVVHALQTHGFVETLRGRAGGLRLARPAERISVGAVFRLFEGDIPFAECFAPQTNSCPLAAGCRLRPVITRALDAFYDELDRVTLADLVTDNCGLAALLGVTGQLRASCPA